MDDWSKLPETLIQNDALDVEKRAARVARLHGILRRVADDAREAIIRPPSHEKTVCTTVDLSDDQLQQLVQQAYDYYTQPAPEGAVWQNRDNERHEDGRYAKFIDEIKSEARIDPKRIYTDAARTFAYGTDASFYRLIPKVVVKVSDEDEVIRVLVSPEMEGVEYKHAECYRK